MDLHLTNKSSHASFNFNMLKVLSPSATLSSKTVIFSSSRRRSFRNLMKTPLVNPLELSSKASASWQLHKHNISQHNMSDREQTVLQHVISGWKQRHSITHVAYPNTILAVTLSTTFGVAPSCTFLKQYVLVLE